MAYKETVGYSIYCVTNRVNGKIYIGKTKNVASRWAVHKHDAHRRPTVFGRAIAKYGHESFIVSILASEIMDESVALRMEVLLIAEYNSNDMAIGYNLTSGGEGASGYHPTEETRRKLSIAAKGNNNPRFGIRGELHPSFGRPGPNLGKKAFVETRRKMSDGRRAGPNNPMFGKPSARRGVTLSDETKRKIAETKIGKPRSPETIAKIIATRVANKLSKENHDGF